MTRDVDRAIQIALDIAGAVENHESKKKEAKLGQTIVVIFSRDASASKVATELRISSMSFWANDWYTNSSSFSSISAIFLILYKKLSNSFGMEARKTRLMYVVH